MHERTDTPATVKMREFSRMNSFRRDVVEPRTSRARASIRRGRRITFGCSLQPQGISLLADAIPSYYFEEWIGTFGRRDSSRPLVTKLLVYLANLGSLTQTFIFYFDKELSRRRVNESFDDT